VTAGCQECLIRSLFMKHSRNVSELDTGWASALQDRVLGSVAGSLGTLLLVAVQC
jgi:hypothetical protein